MLYFTIALRSKASTNRWDAVTADFEATLSSIFNQTCGEFCVYVGCNEKPELKNAYDERLRFIYVDTPKPNGWLECCRDRAWKQLACCAAIKKEHPDDVRRGGTFVFPVDADDFVSNRIAEYVNRHPDENGFKSKNGYRWNKGAGYMELSPYFGGSMNVMKLKPQEFPDEMPDIAYCFDKETCVALNEKYPVRWDDIAVEEKMRQLGRPLATLPFPSTIYVLDTGANISSSDPRAAGNSRKRIHFGVLLHKMSFWKYRRLSAKIRQEFGMRG